MKDVTTRVVGLYVLVGLLTGLLTACQVTPTLPLPTRMAPIGPVGPQPQQLTPSPGVPTPTSPPLTQVTVRVRIPDNTPIHQGIFFTQVDELTGVPVWPQRTAMRAVGPQMYEVVLTVPVGSVLTYRYERRTPEGAFVQEHRWDGQPVRYRVLKVVGPMTLEDIVARWTDTPYTGPPPGRFQGRVVHATSRVPVGQAIVFIGGYQRLTNALGEFLVEGLPPGLHNVVVMDLQGQYRVFQQLAEIAPEATTPAEIPLQAANLVPVRFVVYPPEGTPAGAPVRLIGHWYSLGNTFGDLRGGLSALAVRAPQLQWDPNGGYYTLTLQLPAEEELRFKFTLGDGLLNAELDAQGRFVLRRLLVPPEGGQVEVRIARWRWSNAAPVWFEVRVPPYTPPEDIISLQLAYNTWGEPLPMWYLGDNRWGYMFYGPLPEGMTLRYRYCRNQQCEVAAEAGRAGQEGRRLRGTALPQRMDDQVKAWANFQPPQPLELVSPPATVRAPEFVTGVAWMAQYHPSWQIQEVLALQRIQDTGATHVLFQPTWAALQAAPYPTFAPQAGQDALVPDIGRWIRQAQQRGLQAWLFPQVRYPEGLRAWWQQAPRDYPWWVAWYERYASMLRHYAAIGGQSRASGLIVGGWEGWFSFPNREIVPQVPSGAPLDAEARWAQMLRDLRALYSGPIYWALPDTPEGLQLPPGILENIDGVLLLWNPPAATPEQAADPQALLNLYTTDFQARVEPWARSLSRPVWVGLRFPAAQGVLNGCIQDPEERTCLPPEALYPPQGLSRATLDLEAQWQGLHAALQALNQQGDWLAGVVVFSWYPPVAVQEPSENVYGKPAQQVLRYWFRQWRGGNP